MQDNPLPEPEDAGETLPDAAPAGGSYEYLLSMPIYSLTLEKVHKTNTAL